MGFMKRVLLLNKEITTLGTVEHISILWAMMHKAL